MKKIFLLPIFLGSYIFAYSQANENTSEIKTRELDEVVVKARNAWIEGNKYVFIPQKREKNLSGTMEDLIERMHTGVLRVEDGKITTQSGQPVSVFIVHAQSKCAFSND